MARPSSTSGTPPDARPSRRPGSRRSWFTVGAVVASAAFGARATPAQAAEAAGAGSARNAGVPQAAIVRLERSIDPWERPEDVLANAYRTLRAPAGSHPAPQRQEPGAAANDEARVATYRFDISAGPLSTAIRRFEQITGLQVTVDDDLIRRMNTNGASGTLTATDALDALLEGTALSHRSIGLGRIAIELRLVSDTVNVAGEAPELSSPKYTAPLRDTPQTVVVIPSEVIVEQGATSLRDALRNTPGITLTAGEGGTAPGDNLLIRGFNARNDVYVDGARDAGVVSRDTFNTESVEVAKGPSSVVTGRGAAGGSVNLVTKTANLADEATGRFTVGTAESGRGTIDVNRRLGLTTGLRLNAMWQNAGVPRRDEVRQRAWGFAPSLALGLGTPTEVTLSYQHLQQNNVPDYGLPATLPPPAAAEGVTVNDLDFGNFYGLVSRDFEKTKADLGTATVEHRFDSSTSIRNLTRFGRNDLDRVVTPPRAANASSVADPGFDDSGMQVRRTDTKYQFRTDSTVVNQTDLTLRRRTGRVAHALVTGLELSRESQPSYGVTDTFEHGRPPVTDLFRPNPADAYVPTLERTGATSDGTALSASLYAFDTMKTGDRWQVDVGVRWDRVSVDYETRDVDGVTAHYARTDRAVSGRAGLVFKPAEAGSIYAVYSTSFSPSFDGSFGLALTDRSGSIADLPPERTHNVEVGTKWDLRPGLAFTSAIFRTERVNAKTRDDAGATVLAGDQIVGGLELGLSGALTSRWDVFAGLSLMQSEIVESGVAEEVGRQLAYVPKTSFNVWSSYRLAHLTLGAGAQFTDGYFFNNTNESSSENAAAIQALTRYWLFNAMATWDVTPNLALQVNATNLANARYVERGYSGHFIPGPGRGVLVGPTFRF